MSTYHPHARRERVTGAVALVSVLLGVLIIGFFRVQVLRSNTWVLQSDNNQFRLLSVPAPRGTIFDRNGRILADDVPGYQVSLAPQPSDSTRLALERMSAYLEIRGSRMDELLARAEANPLAVLVVDTDAPFEAVSALEERRSEFPALLVEPRPQRRYPAGRAISHVLGYVNQISPEELESPEFEAYRQGMLVGKAGLERQYESILRGEDGIASVEVDVWGRIVGSVAGVVDVPAQAGGDLRVTIDRELQEFLHSIFPDTLAGAVVALDPSDGGVLALYSAPAYDPNDWVGGIDTETYDRLNRDPLRPLLDRTVYGRYPPASTWKLVTAAIGLELGVIRQDERMPVPCTGSISILGRRSVRCWAPEGHGDVDLEEAVKHSCDVYFYQVGERIGLERYIEEVNRLGLADRCGIDMPQELRTTFPQDLDYYRQRDQFVPPAEVLNLVIGQGATDTTPLKIAQLYSALATDGTAPAPRLFMGEESGTRLDLQLSPENLEVLQRGLLRTMTEDGGTAHLSMVEHWEILGKTGTAQNSGPDHAWFAGIAGRPGAEPEIVIVVFVEHGLHGSDFAAVATKSADFYLRRKYGMPIEELQTLREHIMVGPWPDWAQVPTPPGGG